ncbi:Electron transfer flavoprotein small subunit [Arcanobacterium haemolyticum]|uniref:electron transfer flavoprotein subunit beta/FixA family protein n=1 Tax=Arcanobacterium haemolyticum TaxID=28264 RepID=UPI000D9F25C6|nr:electron transfer flavoprotein beta subunit/FixA family protein [Arcanobacterium haemolyticum]SPT75060.1 Electron transfer flavoprotein small subunit [Arcanobacterium haemolyticum]
MSVVVAYKYTTNPQDARVGADGTVDWSRAKPAMSDYDPVAAQVGKELATQMGTESIGISVGPAVIGGSMARKNAMSKGFSRGLIVADDAATDFNPTQNAHVLAQLVERIGDVQVVITGDASIDNGASMTSAVLGGYLGWPTFQQVEAIEVTEAGLRLTQQIPGGTRTIDISGPVVVAVTSDAARVPAPSMKEILAAGKTPVEVLALADMAAPPAGLTHAGNEKPAERERKRTIFAGPDAVNELVVALRADGVL